MLVCCIPTLMGFSDPHLVASSAFTKILLQTSYTRRMKPMFWKSRKSKPLHCHFLILLDYQSLDPVCPQPELELCVSAV
ncbi:hypothetical protein GDO81_015282 [Engystomops pustulosus]|uniref:Uncharacterized protein n=1 Tax=Engystomops pustulosus TaxID=76066 RepID=A0AAV7AI50_ENGPU|nr:hypothetical protein GDO81_015282 [Engystomops pustulosus]